MGIAMAIATTVPLTREALIMGALPMIGMGTVRGPIMATPMRMAADLLITIRMRTAADRMMAAPMLIRMRLARTLCSPLYWVSSCLAIETRLDLKHARGCTRA